MRKRLQIATSVTFRSETGQLRIRFDPADRFNHFRAEPAAKSCFLRFVVGGGLGNPPARLRRERRRSSPKLPVNLRNDFCERSALRQPGVDPLDPALDLFLPRAVDFGLSIRFAAFQKRASESQLLVVRQPQRILRDLRQLRTHEPILRLPKAVSRPGLLRRGRALAAGSAASSRNGPPRTSGSSTPPSPSALVSAS